MSNLDTTFDSASAAVGPQGTRNPSCPRDEPPASSPARKGPKTTPVRPSATLGFVRAGLLLVLGFFASTIPVNAGRQWVVVDRFDRPLPGQPPSGWPYNRVGGDRGLIYDATKATLSITDPPGQSFYRFEIQRTAVGEQWSIFGGWQSVVRNKSNLSMLAFDKVLHPAIRPEFQARVTGVGLIVRSLASPSGRSDLNLRVEFKRFDSSGNEVLVTQTGWNRGQLLSAMLPGHLRLPLPSDLSAPFGVIVWVLDRAVAGDALEIEGVELELESPALPTETAGLVWSLNSLLRNWDPVSGMIQDVSRFTDGAFENVTATGKFSKLIALGGRLGIVDAAFASNTVARVADTLLDTVPRGPAGKNQLWPHFTANGGTRRIADSEWASGDTAYAATDLLVALRVVGDTSSRYARTLGFLRSIDWTALRTARGGFSHGYLPDGSLSPYDWFGFGAETAGVILAAKIAGVSGEMGPPPTDNGAGFILHVAYPVPFLGRDRWGNDWTYQRTNEIARQIAWYSQPGHANPALVARRWFGLSPGERPEGWAPNPADIYQAYGLGGPFGAPIDGEHTVMLPHYSAMIASLAPTPARALWNSLQAEGLFTPLNNLESIGLPTDGQSPIVNALKGSWNIALQAEGWAFAMPGVRSEVLRSIESDPALAEAYHFVFPPEVVPPELQTQPTTTTGLRVETHDREFGTNTMNSLAFDGRYFLAVGDDGTIHRSRDGRFWLPAASNTANELLSVASDGATHRSVAVGRMGAVRFSADGLNWLTLTTPATNDLLAVAWGNGEWAAVGQRGTLIVSSDGILWTQRTVPVTNDLTSIAYGNGRYVICGGRLLVATNLALGIWIQPDWPEYFRAVSVAFGAGRFVMSGSVVGELVDAGEWADSVDALSWSQLYCCLVDATIAPSFAGGGFLGGGLVFPIFGPSDTDTPILSYLATYLSDDVSWDTLNHGYMPKDSWDYGFLRGQQLNAFAYGAGKVVGVGWESLLTGVWVPHLARPRFDGTNLTLQVHTTPGQRITLQTSDDALHWSDTGLETVADGDGNAQFLIASTGSTGHRFFRAVSP